ncbi:MAG TPA: hypothetical protein VN786_00155 [Acidimicrobiales bacterium]|nr:hypothetical protein [Acidimicrobiales bacterium]
MVGPARDSPAEIMVMFTPETLPVLAAWQQARAGGAAGYRSQA